MCGIFFSVVNDENVREVKPPPNYIYKEIFKLIKYTQRMMKSILLFCVKEAPTRSRPNA